MIITHGTNLIGVSENTNEPQKAVDVYQTLLALWGGVWGQDYYQHRYEWGEGSTTV